MIGKMSVLLGSILVLAAGAARASEPATCTADLPPEGSPLRRLTPTEFDNTIRDLLDDDSRPGRRFPEEGGSGFDNNAHLSIATRLHAQKYMAVAEEIAGRATKLPPDDAAARAWIPEFGLRAFRRPLMPEEVSRFQSLYRSARRNTDVQGASRMVLQAILQSPHFLYRVEVGKPDAARPGLRRLGDHELASRLSYFIWATMPDEELFRAAAAGQLHTAEQVAAQARRLLADDRARIMVRRFYEQWLELTDLAAAGKDRKVFPGFGREVLSLFRQEFDRFIDYATWESDGRIETLLTSPVTFVNGRLASHYDLPGVDGDAFVKVEAPGKRAGILTLGAFLVTHAKTTETSPIKRGVFMREHLLCQIPPPPPDNVNVKLPQPSKDLVTLRDRMEEHRQEIGCSKCHALFDPLGLALESYDATGRWRATDNGRPVDAAGKLIQTDVDGNFENAIDLASRLGRSEQVRDCYVKQWFRYAFGRTEAPADACTITTLKRMFDARNHDVRELLVALTQTDAFYYRVGDQPR